MPDRTIEPTAASPAAAPSDRDAHLPSDRDEKAGDEAGTQGGNPQHDHTGRRSCRRTRTWNRACRTRSGSARRTTCRRRPTIVELRASALQSAHEIGDVAEPRGGEQPTDHEQRSVLRDAADREDETQAGAEIG